MSSSGCFGARTWVGMYENGDVPITQLRRGDVVMHGFKVECVVECTGVYPVLDTLGLSISAWHPVRASGREWEFPVHWDTTQYTCGFTTKVYNVILDKGHFLENINWQCITLGHGMQDPIARHAFYGTQKVIEFLSGQPGYEEGYVRTTQKAMSRAAERTLRNEVSSMKPTASSVFVSRIPKDMNEEQLAGVFRHFGEVVRFRLVVRHDTRESTGYGFCDFVEEDTAQKAALYNGDIQVAGTYLRVAIAT